MALDERAIVRKWDDQRGFGFVLIPEIGIEAFLHVTELPDGRVSLRVGERIICDTHESSKGLRAINARLLPEE
jgi:cold shock CspA family protein